MLTARSRNHSQSASSSNTVSNTSSRTTVKDESNARSLSGLKPKPVFVKPSDVVSVATHSSRSGLLASKTPKSSSWHSAVTGTDNTEQLASSRPLSNQTFATSTLGSACASQSRLPVLKKKQSSVRPVPDFAKLHKTWESKLASGKSIKSSSQDITTSNKLFEKSTSNNGACSFPSSADSDIVPKSAAYRKPTPFAIQTNQQKSQLLEPKASTPLLSTTGSATLKNDTKPSQAVSTQHNTVHSPHNEEFNNASLANILTSTSSHELDMAHSDDIETRSYGVLKRRTTLAQLSNFSEKYSAEDTGSSTRGNRRVGEIASTIQHEDLRVLKRTSLFQAPIRVARKPSHIELSRKNNDLLGPLVSAEKELTITSQQQELQRYPARLLGQASRTPNASKIATLPFTPRTFANKDLARALGKALMETSTPPAREPTTPRQSMFGGVQSSLNTTLSTDTAPLHYDQGRGYAFSVQTEQSNLVLTQYQPPSTISSHPDSIVEKTVQISKPRGQLPNPFDVLGITPHSTFSWTNSTLLSKGSYTGLPEGEDIKLETFSYSAANGLNTSFDPPSCTDDSSTIASLQSELDKLTSMEEALMRELEHETLS
ncbi:hypothetical protein BATDEDRAFT_24845 [Batrachochytrium dendrobatidis JAM81]|uniref:Uncharacterized protein n=1 Tax=Batrachochytrium dendrobatidis (strain JAM81 / FGSC 10211) TaxID=684364 RepID=F4P374_BATDJ|nr:uncharacterized protein BATDEDRAFT_24845 [Batrachochytrium dendrobatidis JAM81]EGF80096.1 hypothetical protein BATDEDRAFT_24845 [Batrachochytrium dendrobatidis JAM81]|eukprot:XP_006678941.1 hypothetical protein BATDEDRAFT_24845 [Batrachochytrium dendrobatidis JAM81]